jgi:hypothetical protein
VCEQLKRHCRKIFPLGFFPLKHPSWAPDKGAKAFSQNRIREEIRNFRYACAFNDTACMVHAGPLTPHTKRNFLTTYYRRNGFAMQNMTHWHRMHNGRTIRTALAPLKGISVKTPPLQNYLNLRGVTNKKISCMRWHWHRKHENRRLKCRISSRIRSRIQKGISPLINQGIMGDCLWKNAGRKSRDTVPLSETYRN